MESCFDTFVKVYALEQMWNLLPESVMDVDSLEGFKMMNVWRLQYAQLGERSGQRIELTSAGIDKC